MWNPLAKLKEKISGTPASPEAAKAAEAALAAGGAATPDLKELEKQGMLGKFFRYWKNPAFLAQMKAVAAAMQADGVDLKDQKAVKAWVEKHQKDIADGKYASAPAASKEAPRTFVHAGPALGRNDPCSCGSGKKYKKCCAAKAG